MFPADDREGFSAKAGKWVAEKRVHEQICDQCLGKIKPAQAISDGIEAGFTTPFGPFGLQRFKNELKFKLYLQKRINAAIHHKNV